MAQMAQGGPATARADAPRISREVLEDRWNGLVTAPWRPGQYSKLHHRLQVVLVDLVNGTGAAPEPVR